jgi:dephospho-CoA kinase
MARSGLDCDEVKAMLAAQASRSERLSAADDVIDNTLSQECLDAQVATLHQRYLAIGRGSPP